MKRLKYGLLAAAMVASSAAFIPASADAATEGWQTASNGKRWYQYEDGSYAKNEFIGGYWINKAGWVDDTTTYGWQKFGIQKTDGTIKSARWQYGNTKWLAGKTKEKNQWWKIDGDWYFFHADGFMAQNEFVGKYYLTETGQWDADVRGAWEKQTDGTWKFKKTTSEAEEYITGWMTISGYEYHFQEDGTLDTWKLIVDDKYDLDDEEVYAFGGNGHLGRYTEFISTGKEFKDYKLSFDFATVGDAKAAMAEVKDLLLGAYYDDVNGMKPEDAKVFYIDTPTFEDRMVVVGIGAKDNTTDASIVVNTDGTITYNKATNSKIYTPNVFIELSDAQYAYLQNLEAYGLKKYDGSYMSVDVATEDDENVDKTLIPITNYANYFVESKKVDITWHTSLDYLFWKWKGFSASTSTDFDFTITAPAAKGKGTVEFKLSHVGLSSQYFVIKVDGKNYQGVYNVTPVKDDNGKITKWVEDFYFLSNVSQTLGRKLYDAGLVSDYYVFDCLDWEADSELIDPDTNKDVSDHGWVSYAQEDLFKQKAATSTNQ